MIIYSALYPSFAHLELLEQAEEWTTVYIPEHITRTDAILILHGGSDLSPTLYGETPNKHTGANASLSYRDQVELALYHKARQLNIPIFGICRGAQLLCIMAGGKLVQHTNGHHGDHRITTNDGQFLKTNSAHHQMMFLQNTHHELIAWSTKPLSSKYLGENEQPLQITTEPEIVFFPKIKGLAVQGHPEWLSKDASLVKLCLTLTKQKLLQNGTT